MGHLTVPEFSKSRLELTSERFFVNSYDIFLLRKASPNFLGPYCLQVSTAVNHLPKVDLSELWGRGETTWGSKMAKIDEIKSAVRGQKKMT